METGAAQIGRDDKMMGNLAAAAEAQDKNRKDEFWKKTRNKKICHLLFFFSKKDPETEYQAQILSYQRQVAVLVPRTIGYLLATCKTL